MIHTPYQVETISDWKKIEQVLLLFDASFPRPLSDRIGSLENYARKLADNAVVYIVSSEENIAGFAACYCNETMTKQAFMAQLVVHDSYRGLNIGGMLVELCIEKSRQEGMEKIILEVDDNNVPAINLYKKYGFTNPQEASEFSHFWEKIL